MKTTHHWLYTETVRQEGDRTIIDLDLRPMGHACDAVSLVFIIVLLTASIITLRNQRKGKS